MAATCSSVDFAHRRDDELGATEEDRLRGVLQGDQARHRSCDFGMFRSLVVEHADRLDNRPLVLLAIRLACERRVDSGGKRREVQRLSYLEWSEEVVPAPAVVEPVWLDSPRKLGSTAGFGVANLAVIMSSFPPKHVTP